LRQAIELSNCRLSLRHDPLRLPTRRFSLDTSDLEDEFDFTTLFNGSHNLAQHDAGGWKPTTASDHTSATLQVK
jgi:hypothetical protein